MEQKTQKMFSLPQYASLLEDIDGRCLESYVDLIANRQSHSVERVPSNKAHKIRRDLYREKQCGALVDDGGYGP